MSDIEWHYIITQDGEVLPVDEAVQQISAIGLAAQRVAAHLSALGEQMVAAAQQVMEAIAELFGPVLESVVAFVRSWWCSLPPWTRSWLRRRVRRADVTGPPRLALFAAQWSVKRL